ncbi:MULTISPECIES: hotdog domain-containing protein [unclassified Shewanella]|uniref:hotdog domain-containing protein n=1 Tax=unclassified Shewanella TaxID=196818 RepID=UPI0009711FEA|nr:MULTISPECIES: hotdog domain-containing protein [unclassified Shewanella]MDO6618640.1 hotdog domain-containing protein [Shewanella sp. 6_MG-2023]MDO6641143.1 hotdog domain-containing protein [Shewanella sp. 5_MG-2023]MDO6678555.1 hotdog domain-containing protein [Shewanella sp. 4_MG-2023]MDO6774703.1 hotdog domain-containing protein [Shewanella sp. 3_MG-2023]PMG31997.1 acyl-CoA thioesterase [Shewanella sp. 10N.286.52.C2]
MEYLGRHIVKPVNLNAEQSLCCGQLLMWLNQEASIFARCQMHSKQLMAKLVSEINFMSPAKMGDVIEFGMEAISLGQSSITLRCKVRNSLSNAPIAYIDKIVFVNINERGLPIPHGIRANAA